MTSSPTCPHCGQADKTYKVSLLYLESTARLHQRQAEDQPELDGLLSDLLPANSSSTSQAQLLTRLLHSFTPPSGEKHITRRIHPDAMVIFFGIFLLLLAYRAATTQPGQLPAVLILVCGSALAYLLARKAILRRYEERIRQEQQENERIENAVARWMRLYFCSRDQGVFDPDEEPFVPLERMSETLMRGEASRAQRSARSAP